MGLVWLGVFFGVGFAAPVRAGDVGPDDVNGAGDTRATRESATLTARADLVREQGATARTRARWRVRELYRLLVAGAEPDLYLPAVTRARAVAVGTRALARELVEARALGEEAGLASGERDAIAAAVAAEPAVGARPALALPVAGAVLARFGTGPDAATGLLVARAGIQLASRPGTPVRAPAAGHVVRVDSEPGAGFTVVIDHGAGWTTIVGGLAAVAVAPGATLGAAQALGTSATTVSFEIWRGRRPIDPLLPHLLATPSALP